MPKAVSRCDDLGVVTSLRRCLQVHGYNRAEANEVKGESEAVFGYARRSVVIADFAARTRAYLYVFFYYDSRQRRAC